jgi:uncharacterized protein (TIGR03437 family)
MTWTAATAVPPEAISNALGDTSTYGATSLAVGSKGQGIVSMSSLSAGGPLVDTTADFITWTYPQGVSGANPSTVNASNQLVAYDSTDRVYDAFLNSDTTTFPAGIALYYQPAAVTPPPTPPSPQIGAGGIGNAASDQTEISPDSLASIFGTNFLIGNPVQASSTPLPNSLGGVSVTVNNVPAPMIYVNPTQINFQVPYETAVGPANVIVTANTVASNTAQITVVSAAPGIFVYGNNLAVVQNQDHSVNSPTNPAKLGSSVVIYLTGGGPLDNAVPTGAVAPDSPLSRLTTKPITVTMGGAAANVAFAGLTPGFIGLVQINATVPASLTTGAYPLQVTIGSVSSNTPNISVTE